MPHTRHGFTLLELSIVVVVIGMIVGAVLVGKEMVRNSELNSIVRDAQQFRTAVNTFEEKYRWLPGDIRNASKYWPGETDGNGDGFITWPESDHAWRHLVKAGIISGNFSGTGDLATSITDSPSARVTGVGWSFLASGGNSLTWFNSNAYITATFLNVGKFGAAYNATPFLTPREAMQIDQKADDGLPYKGNIIGPMLDWQPTCSTGTSGNYRYNVSLTTDVCFMNFMVTK